ncbi:16S rRNA (cytosine967-C5)-methyltransferase [Sphaerotilus hippei]|uniref:16S rRNA (cytosine(967)-C(5))-methyltransferase n=1 Tax=Sphaerotilus hippei TaxID=744406 RepID=A0A318GWR1_9BURK|nr:16S rRNA (cytosine(967)-C(5))-methyltransferase RsmB [Sphaerotilus hippei]PXW93513.1 16S rRNA (cytosine967-C5)-methyltransferase [Sphaerotilus hippei]
MKPDRSPRPSTPTGRPAPGQALPLATLLEHTAHAVAAVRAGRSLTDALADCPPAARPGCQALSFHVMKHLGGAQAARAALVPRQPPAEVEALLLCALALLWPDGEPPYGEHTLVDQTVRCARQRTPAQAGFINAVLRRFLRERAALVPRLEQSDPVARFQHPRWWIARVRQDWPQQAEALLAANQVHAPMALRVNARHGDASRYLAELAGIDLPAIAAGEHAVVLDRAVPVDRLPGFAEGRVSVQDLSAQRAALLVLGQGDERLPEGARVLDACSAPGGKTAHLLELATLDLTALDADASRLERVAGTLQRLQLHARLQAADAGDVERWWDGQPFDAILLDAPCSASGIVRRHPDARWLRRPGDIPELARLQARLLDRLWPLLRPGGRLIYATCSIFKAEGEDQVEAFLQRTVDAERRNAPGHLLPLVDNSIGSSAAGVGDGFYYARLDKRT